ncbi:MAG: sialidase family protein [Phycisphaerae bacterium]
MQETEAGHIVLELAPCPGRFRSSEGSFITLADGRIMLAYSKFTGGYRDDATAVIVSRTSSDGGRTWTADDELVVASEGARNVMSTSLLRLADGRAAMFYLVKHGWHDCRPVMRTSEDECRTWSPPQQVIATPGYYVVNNDRVVQLASGRIVVPAAWHPPAQGRDGEAGYGPGQATFFLSDDGGKSWRQSTITQLPIPTLWTGLQEPGVVELGGERLFAFCRTDLGCHYGLHSSDGGLTWTEPFPTEFISPVSPMSIKRLPPGTQLGTVPQSGTVPSCSPSCDTNRGQSQTAGLSPLLALYNDHSGRFPFDTVDRGRQPLVSVISRDDGATWTNHRQVEADLSRGYHYTAIHFTADGHVLLAYCAGPKGPGTQLNTLRVRRIEASWFAA